MNRSARTNVRLAFWTPALMMLIAVWGGWDSNLSAQEEAPAAESADAPADQQPAADQAARRSGSAKEGAESLGRLIWVGTNWVGRGFYAVLALFSITAMAVALERVVRLRRARVMPRRFVRRLRDLLSRNQDDIENLRALCQTSTSPISSILRAGVLRAGRPLPEVEKAMEDAAAREMAAMRSRNRPLSVIGSVAPLVGLLGTVVGMIFAFRVSSLAGLGKAELLAEGIYLALLTTAAGLTIAIPCLLLVAWFSTLVELFMREIDETLLEVMPSFTRVENMAVAGRVGAEPEVAAAKL